MAKSSAVWGIDIGQSALKALRCTVGDDGIVVDAYDFIEYPKILSQPEADPDELIREALEQFLSRNSVKGDKVAISVPGQSGLAKFFKPPPVDAKKLPDIVKYEARQQIPFDLADVIWDYQRMAGGAEVDGFALDTEVGLFAMKREQVMKWLRPFTNAKIEVDIVQLAPLSIYNYITFDELSRSMAGKEFDPDAPPESVVVLSMGTDSTDMIVTNGFRVWQRSIPLGGNHFTKQMTKDLKLTFAKAEHLKRNAREAEDPKTLFQAMRPIFNDLVTEVQRSITFFQQIDRKAKIRGIIMLGNSTKLPGLKQYLGKNLGYDVLPYDRFVRLTGETISAPTFKDNAMSFGVCYGLCLQALGEATLKTNLIPREILTDRLIRAKKPWTVAAVAFVMLALAFSFVPYPRVAYEVRKEKWQPSQDGVTSLNSTINSHRTTDSQKVQQLEFVKSLGAQVTGAGERRLSWLELMKAVNAALPYNPDFGPGHRYPVDYPYTKRPELYVDYVETQYFDDLKDYFTDDVKKLYKEGMASLEQFDAALAAGQAPPEQPDAAAAGQDEEKDSGQGDAAATPPAEPDAAAETPAAEPQWPTGPGFVIELSGHHFFNGDRRVGGATHVRQTLIRNLEHGVVDLPGPDGAPLRFTMQELGISYPLIRKDSRIDRAHKIPNPEAKQGTTTAGMTADAFAGPAMTPGASLTGTAGPPSLAGRGAGTGTPAARVPLAFEAPKYDFVVQFCWQERLLSVRIEERKKKEAEEAEKAKQENPADVQPDDVAAN